MPSSAAHETPEHLVCRLLLPSVFLFFFFLMIRRPPRSTLSSSSAASDVYKRQEYLVAWERAARWVEAQRMKAVVAVAGATATNRDDFAREHVKVALSGCGGSARADVDLARHMTGRLAAAGAALARGEISYSHARVLSTETFVLDDATAGQVAAAVLRRDEHRTPSQFRAAVRRAVIRADPVRAELAAERAAKERMVAKQALADGQAALTLTGPAVGVATIWTAADAHAAHPGADDDRTLDQRRFDAVVTICAAALVQGPVVIGPGVG